MDPCLPGIWYSKSATITWQMPIILTVRITSRTPATPCNWPSKSRSKPPPQILQWISKINLYDRNTIIKQVHVNIIYIYVASLSYRRLRGKWHYWKSYSSSSIFFAVFVEIFYSLLYIYRKNVILTIEHFLASIGMMVAISEAKKVLIYSCNHHTRVNSSSYHNSLIN